MWISWHKGRDKDPELLNSTILLLKSNLNTLIFTVMGGLLIWYMIFGILYPQYLFWRFWIVFATTCFITWLAHALLENHILTAQVVWLAGLFITNTLSIFLLERPELVFLYTLLPLLGVTTMGLPAGILLEALLVGVLWWLNQSQFAAFIMPFNTVLVISGLVTGFIGWISGRTLVEEISNSRRNFTLARQNMESAREHRAQLFKVVKDLDKAYYRLERANAALVAAWKEAENAERGKAEFVTFVSHEMRTPLNLIAGFSEMVLTAPESYGSLPLPGLYRADINKIHQNAWHLLGLVDDVIDLSRANIGKLPLTREMVDLKSLISETSEMINDYINTKGLGLRLAVPDSLPTVSVDRLRIRQVLLNLLVNAARFTEKGWIGIEVIPGEREITIKVSDTGRGITEHNLAKVFEGFHTMEQPASSWHSGSGLGLPISKKLIELHDGRMSVESTVNKGTTFSFTLPITTPEKVGKPVTLRPFSVLPFEPKSNELVCVVIHEDARAPRLLQRYMQGCRVIGAADKKTALELVVENRAAMVVANCSIDPAEVGEGVLVVRTDLPSSRAVAEKLGVLDVLYKPVSAAELQAAVDHFAPTAQKILVVDDDYEIVQLFQRMLNPRFPPGTCLGAANGREALDTIRAQRPDLVFLDLNMPEMSGQEVIAELGSDANLSSIPVVVVSGEVQDSAYLVVDSQIQVARQEGWRPDQLAQALQALVSALSPGWQTDSATVSALAEDPPEREA